MQDFLSLSWWISVVVVGIVINLASAYLKPRTDALLSRFSSRWERRSTKKKKEWENFIKRLRDDNTAQIFAYFDMITARIVAVEGLVLSVFCFIIGGWLYTIQILGVGETFSKENPVLSIPVAYNTFFSLGYCCFLLLCLTPCIARRESLRLYEKPEVPHPPMKRNQILMYPK